ncbi:hypothetical protein ABT56_03280 [Photobacterium aquae]|uniref:RNA ligase domain-containing protein n=2 Tax=Photobacterium aquae TaxID=1195763 RepID=A0A0J1HC42_9GAMM|nr:hypothetical protein ABT56_03280 [Photobacterium aquae]
MISEFFRFPHTSHIDWLSNSGARGDKIMSPHEADLFVSTKLTVEEKVDGANVGFSIDNDGNLIAQNRGAWIDRDVGGQFKHLWKWAAPYENQLKAKLGKELILFGEWCYAKHSIRYERLPNWFIGFDIYERSSGRFFSVQRRNELLSSIGIPIVRPIAVGHFSISDLKSLLSTPSSYGANNIEGIYLRKDEDKWLSKRAKLVRPDFTQSIEEHWSRKGIKANRIKY